MKKPSLTILFFILFIHVYSQQIKLSFIPSDAANVIDSLVIKSLNENESITIYASSGFEYNATKGNLYHFDIHSSGNITVIADTPQEPKEYVVEFYKCQDKDGRNYKIVQIGDQWWMAENLAYLPKVFPPSNLSKPEHRFYVYGYKDTITTDAKELESYIKYGVLYNWIAAKECCPDGWHLPTDKEWHQLSDYINEKKGPYDIIDNERHGIGQHLKSNGDWIYSGNGTDDFGFNALPSGIHWAIATNFLSQGYGCRFWADGGTKTTNDANQLETYYYNLYYFFDVLFENQSYRDGGYSLRAIKNK